MRPIVRVVGLGPGSLDHITLRTYELLNSSPVVRLRTRQHPSAMRFEHIESYDELYEKAESFDNLYAAIVDDLVALATRSPSQEVIYAVPGSPVVAERTVELLRQRSEVTTFCEPAVSVIDVVCAALGRDPMSDGLRIVDALETSENFRGPGPLLILQTYSPEILTSVADRLPENILVTVLHHVGLDDEVIRELPVEELMSFENADHLTSLWVAGFRDAGETMNDLIDFMKRLRAECPWDQERTHASLTRYLLEESYEALDALETFVRVEAEGLDDEDAIAHVEEELGDLLFQIVFHAELGDEEGNFNFATIADTVRDKLTGRHPHVFGDVKVTDSNDVKRRWEDLKRSEKGRESVTDGIAWQLPAITLYAKLLRKAVLVDTKFEASDESLLRAIVSLESIVLSEQPVLDDQSLAHVDNSWGDALSSFVAAAQFAGVDLEGVLRDRALLLRDEIRKSEELS